MKFSFGDRHTHIHTQTDTRLLDSVGVQSSTLNSSFLDCMNCKRLREEKKELQAKLKEKEDNLKKALTKISENVSKSRKDKITLENENHRMRIKFAESRVGQMLRNNFSKSTPNLDKISKDR